MELLGHSFIEIPLGTACLGSDVHDPYASDRERPLREVFISTFSISKYPTTRQQFAAYLKDTGQAFDESWGPIDSLGWPQELGASGDLPMVTVSWEEAIRYCLWMTASADRTIDLPSEAEWEKAARGADDRIWPWGDHFDPSRCACAESGIGRLVPVSSFPESASPFGVINMSGLVWEWCRDYYDPDSHIRASHLNPVNLIPAPQRVVKGGSVYCTKEIVRPACRDWTNSINQGGGDDGFRVVLRG